MTEFQEVQVGDRVTVVHDNGDTATFTVTKGVLGSDSLFSAGGMCILSQHWTITDLDRPKPEVELPTEPGIYVSWIEPPSPKIFHKIMSGEWVNADDTEYVDEVTLAKWMPLTKLEPVPVTAKKVLDEVQARCDNSPFRGLSALLTLREVAAHFGVTD